VDHATECVYTATWQVQLQDELGQHDRQLCNGRRFCNPEVTEWHEVFGIVGQIGCRGGLQQSGWK